MVRAHIKRAAPPSPGPGTRTPAGRKAVVRPPRPGWSASLRKLGRLAGQGTQAGALRPGRGHQQLASQPRPAPACGGDVVQPLAQRNPSLEWSVRRRLLSTDGVWSVRAVSHSDGHTLSGPAAISRGWAASCSQAGRPVWARPAPRKTVFSQTQPEPRLPGGPGERGQAPRKSVRATRLNWLGRLRPCPVLGGAWSGGGASRGRPRLSVPAASGRCCGSSAAPCPPGSPHWEGGWGLRGPSRRRVAPLSSPGTDGDGWETMNDTSAGQ